MSLTAIAFDVAVGFVELDAGQRRLDLYAGGATRDGVCFRETKQGRTQALARRNGPDVHRSAMRRAFDDVIAGKSKDGVVAADDSCGDEEHLAAFHRPAVDVAGQPLL